MQRYMHLSGTSMAAPHVTGLAGYMLTFNPDLKPDQIRTYIEENADYCPGQTGYTEELGWGRINTLKTIEAVIKDMEAGNQPPSRYVHSPIRIVTPSNGVTLYLYTSDSQGNPINYVACTITGDSVVGLMDAPNPNLESVAGIAWFNMLREGTYVVKGGLGKSDIGSTPPFTVKAGQKVPDQSLVFKGKPLHIQSILTQNAQDTAGR
jgi:hypothetical protein